MLFVIKFYHLLLVLDQPNSPLPLCTTSLIYSPGFFSSVTVSSVNSSPLDRINAEDIVFGKKPKAFKHVFTNS